MTPRRLSLSLLLVVLGAVLALAGCGGSGASTEDASPADATPRSAVFYGEATIRPDGDLKQSVDAAGKKIAQGKDLGAEIEKALQKSLGDKNSGKLDYKKDVKPWLGKKAAVFVTGVRNGDADFGVLISTSDGSKAQDALDKSNKNDDKKTVERSYRDVKYQYDTSDKSAQAVVDGWLLAATEPAFKATVDAIKDKKGLAQVSAFKTAKSKVASNGLMTFYLDTPRLIDVLAQSGGAQAAIALGQLKSLPQFASLKPTAAAVTVDDSAIRVEAPARTDQGSSDALASLPGDAWFAAAAPNAGKGLRTQVQATEKLPGGATIQQFKSLLRQQTGLDLDRDLLDWVGGFSVFAGGTGLLDLNAAVVIDSNDPGASATAVKKVRRLVERSGRRTTAVKGGFAVQMPGAPGPLTVAARGNKVVAAYGKGSVEKAVNPSGRLSDSKAYKDAQAALGGGKPGFLLSVPAVLQLVQNFGGANDPQAARVLPYFKAFTSLASGMATVNGQKLGRMAVGLK